MNAPQSIESGKAELKLAYSPGRLSDAIRSRKKQTPVTSQFNEAKMLLKR